MKENSAKTTILNILNGISMGVIAALIPAALLGQLMQALSFVWPFATEIINMTTIMQSLLAAISGFCVGYLFKMGPIEMSSIAGAATVASGAVSVQKGAFILNGTGDVINIGITITIAVLVVKLLSGRLGTYNILLMPVLVLLIAGGLGHILLPYVRMITGFIGNIITTFTHLQPHIMGILLGISFAVVIVSPVSSVGLGLAIGVTGISSGAANIGITAAAFTLAIMGFRVNGFGTTIAHFIGTPKIQMANMLEKPVLFIPVIISSGIAGLLAAIFNIQGTPQSAGFGFSGLIGPLAAYEKMNHGIGSVLLLTVLFVIVPIILGLIMRYLFINKFKIIQEKDLYIEAN